MEYSLNSKIKDIIANESLRTQINEVAPGLVDHPQINRVKIFSLKACSKIIPKQLNAEVLAKIEDIFEKENQKNKS